jgi:hypothetical protein
MKSPRKVSVLIIILVLLMQVIQPTRNKSDGLGDADISKTVEIRQEIHQTLINKCYDCHSNNTRYPWYFHIQPIGWWLAAHVHDGKEHLNFSEFKNYDAEKAENKLEDLKEVTEDGAMPLKAYVMLHPESELTDADKNAILTWLASLKKED